MNITLIRHAPTESNASNTYMGSIDAPATAEGLQQAKDLGMRLERPGFAVSYSSPLLRARATLEAIHPACDIFLDTRLMERSLGLWEGMKREVVRDEFPEGFLSSGAFNPGFTPPGGETFDDFCSRIWAFLSELSEKQTGNMIVVTHNGWIRTALYLVGCISKDEIFEADEPHLTPLHLTYGKSHHHGAPA